MIIKFFEKERTKFDTSSNMPKPQNSFLVEKNFRGKVIFYAKAECNLNEIKF